MIIIKKISVADKFKDIQGVVWWNSRTPDGPSDITQPTERLTKINYLIKQDKQNIN